MEGSVCVIVHTLYGLKTNANAWCTHMCSALKDTEFEHSLANNDFWLKKDAKGDVIFYYSYFLVYVDDIRILSKDPRIYVESLSKHYYINESSIGTPDLYLGTQYKLVTGRSGNLAWSSSTDCYVKRSYFNCVRTNGYHGPEAYQEVQVSCIIPTGIRCV